MKRKTSKDTQPELLIYDYDSTSRTCQKYCDYQYSAVIQQNELNKRLVETIISALSTLKNVYTTLEHPSVKLAAEAVDQISSLENNLSSLTQELERLEDKIRNMQSA